MREKLLSLEEKNWQRYNPCYYCRKMYTCRIGCVARIGFANIVSEKLDRFYDKSIDWESRFLDNARKYKLPTPWVQ